MTGIETEFELQLQDAPDVDYSKIMYKLDAALSLTETLQRLHADGVNLGKNMHQIERDWVGPVWRGQVLGFWPIIKRTRRDGNGSAMHADLGDPDWNTDIIGYACSKGQGGGEYYRESLGTRRGIAQAPLTEEEVDRVMDVVQNPLSNDELTEVRAFLAFWRAVRA